MKLLEEKYGTIEYDPSVPCITASFIGFMSSEQFRDFLDKRLQFMIEKKKNHKKILWLADTSKHVVQPDQDTKWVAAVAVKDGLLVPYFSSNNFIGVVKFY